MRSLFLLVLLCSSLFSYSTNYYVSANTGVDLNNNLGNAANPFKTILKAYNFSSAVVTDSIFVEPGNYPETTNIVITHPVVIKKIGIGEAIIDANARSVNQIEKYCIQILNTSHVTIQGLSIRNNHGPSSKGIYILSDNTNTAVMEDIEIKEVHLDHIGWWNDDLLLLPTNSSVHIANALVVQCCNPYPMTNIRILHDTIKHCATGIGEAFNFIGNIDGAMVSYNLIDSISNIGLDLAGKKNYATTASPAMDIVRNVTVSHNEISHCMSRVAKSAGLYMDGSRHNTIEFNYLHHNGVGLSLGCEIFTPDSTGFHIVRNNVIVRNAINGMVIGTEDTTGLYGVYNNEIYHNTLALNASGEFINGVDTVGNSAVLNMALWDGGEVLLSTNTNNHFYYNLIQAQNAKLCLSTGEKRHISNFISNYNLYFNNSTAALIQINDNTYSFNNTSPTSTQQFNNLPSFTTQYNLEQNSIEGNPNFLFNSPDSFAIGGNSSALNMGGTYNSALEGVLDYAGNPRLAASSPDAGAYEYVGFPTSIHNANTKRLLLYPNPTQQYVHLVLSGEEIKHIDCIDILGQRTTLSYNQDIVDLRSLAAGSYLIQVYTTNGTLYYAQCSKD